MADPIKWGRGREAAFKSWIDHELIDAINAREPLLQQWLRWLEMYRAPARQPTKNFPFEGASNVVLPVIAIDVDQLYSKFMQTIHAPQNLWTLQALNERWVDTTKPMQDLLSWLDATVLRMRNVNERVLLEMTKLGTGIYKTGWTYERRPIWQYDESGKIVKAEAIRGVPFVDHVRLADFLIPAYSYAVQPDAQGGAPWVGERMRVSVQKLRWMAESAEPHLPNVDPKTLDLIIKFEESGATNYDEYVRMSEREKMGSALPSSESLEWDKSSTQMGGQAGTAGIRVVREVELWEIHARFPTREDPSEDDIIVWYHHPTQTVVRAVYNYFRHGQRPYDVVRYFPTEGFYGMGVCEQKEMFQTIASDLHNFNTDNVLLANSRMVVAKAGANIAPGEPFYPNKVWIVDDDINKSFGVFPMADIYQSLPLLQSQNQALGERRTGISDIQLGNLQELPGRTPATTMLSLLQEGNRRPDLTVKSIREGLSAVGLRIIQMLQQYATATVDVGGQHLLQVAVETLGMPEGQLVAEKLTTPFEDAALGVGVSITATSGSANKEVERQGYLALLQLAAQLYPQFVQGLAAVPQLMAVGATAAAEAAVKSAQGLQELFQRLLEQYDIRNPEEILPLSDQTGDNALQQGAIQGTLMAGATGANGGSSPSPGGNGVEPTLAALFSGTGAGL